MRTGESSAAPVAGTTAAPSPTPSSTPPSTPSSTPLSAASPAHSDGRSEREHPSAPSSEPSEPPLPAAASAPTGPSPFPHPARGSGESSAQVPHSPLRGTCAELTALLRRGLAGHGMDVDVHVSPMGVHDAFAVGTKTGTGAGPSPGPGAGPVHAAADPAPLRAPQAPPGAVPVRLYGRHAVIGPFPPAATGPGVPPPPSPASAATAHRSPAASAAPAAPTGSTAPTTPVPEAPAATGDEAARPCPQCLERRWQAVRSVALREALELGSGTRAAGESPYVTAFTAEALAAVIAAEPHGPATAGGGFPAVRLVELDSLRSRRYPLVPDPECPHCGRPEEDTAEAAALTLRPAPKHRPGSFRVRDIDAWDLPAEPYANPVCGALGPSVVYDVSSTSTAAAIGCFSMRSGDYLRETFWGGHADNFAHSLRIGVLEGLERYAGMRSRARTAAVIDSLERLHRGGVPALDPRRCGLYSAEFHRAHPHIAPFTPRRRIPWVWGYSLRDLRPVLVPEVLAYYHAPGLENRFVQESSNGCASGGCLEEAVYAGLMEVVERDAFLLTWYGQAALPEIDPATSARPATRHMVDRLAMYGYRARFFDTRITFPIPVVTAVAERFDGGLGRMCFGAGAGLDPESALAAALCEISTDAVNLPGRTERDEARLRAMADDFHRVTALHDHPLVYGIPEMGRYAEFLLGARDGRCPPRHSMAELYGDGSVPPVSDDLRDDLQTCLAAVTGAGFDVLVVDQTMPEQRELGLTTVGVIVPGLLPIDFGWSRQRALTMPRLRTALKEAGMRAGELSSADINPAPHPFP